MPGVPDKKQQQVALPAETPPASIPQPRQPQNLQSLLRFAMEAQEATGNTSDRPQSRQDPQPLDPERREFLQEALQSMSVDVIAIMKENIAKLQNVSDLTEEQVEEKIESFEAIANYVDNIDVANDFHKINGFSVFEPCLNCAHARIRAHVADLIAELAQNNPHVQAAICECTEVVPTLIRILREDEDAQVKVKALYAISCVARESRVGYASFKTHEGLEAMRDALKTGDDKLRTKAAFLLSSLRSVDENVARDMLRMGFVGVIVDGLEAANGDSHEHLLRLLKLLLEAQKSSGGGMDGDLRERLEERLAKISNCVAGMPEYLESEEYCKQLRELLQ